MSSDQETRALPPRLGCPRCGTQSIPDTATRCGHCRLQLVCHACNERFEDPVNQAFCTVCGASVDQPPWPPPDAIPEQPAEAAGKSGTERARKIAPVGDLFARVDAPAVLSSLGQRAARRSGRIARRTVRHVLFDNVVQLYLQLGEALMERERFAEATEMYRKALREAGEDARNRRAIYASLAESSARAAEQAPEMRPDAIRAALEAAARDPDVLGPTVERVADLLDSEVLEAHGAWIASSWWLDVERVAAGVARVDCALICGRAALFVGEVDRALELLREARAVNADAARDKARRTMPSPLLPDRLLSAAPAQMRLTQARAREAVGDDEGALRDAEAALAAGFGADAEGQIAARRMRARLLLRSGDGPQAALALVGLARALTSESEYDDAKDQIAAARRLAPGAPEPMWQLADTCRFAAQLDDPPFADPDALDRAREAALDGFERRPPARQDAWAYCVLALLDDQLGEFAEEPGTWIAEGLLATEQALALDPDHGDAWALNSRFCRELRLFNAALLAAQRATRDAANTLLAAQEEAALHVRIDSPDAPQVLARHKTTLSVLEGRRFAADGYLKLLKGDGHAAFKKLDRAVRASPAEPWFRLYRALAAELTGDADLAQGDYERICKTVGDGVSSSLPARAWAAAFAGRDEAASLFERMPGGTGPDPCQRSAGLAACAALRGDVAGLRRRLDEALAEVRVRGEAAAVAMYLNALEQRTDGELRSAVAAGRRAAAEAAEAAPVPRTADLDAAIEEVGLLAGAAQRGGVLWRAASVLLARLKSDRGDWDGAEEIYRAVAEQGGGVRPLPELRELHVRALRQASASAQRRGDVTRAEAIEQRIDELGASTPGQRELALAAAHQAHGDPQRAVECLRPLLEESLEGDAMLRVGDALLAADAIVLARAAYSGAGATKLAGSAELRLGLVAAARDEIAEARQWLLLAVNGFAGNFGDVAARLVVDELYRLVSDRHRDQLELVLRALDGDASMPGLRRGKIVAARLANVGQRTDGPRLAPVKAMAISIDARHFDRSADAPIPGRLVSVECPALRERLAARTGVGLPGIRVRAHHEPLADGMDYAILVREIRVASGVLPAGASLCTEGDRCAELGLHGRRVATGHRMEDAVWLDADNAAAAERAGLPLLDHAAGIAWHVEVAVRPRLAQFIGLSELEFQVDEWTSQGEARLELRQRALPDRRARTDFARLLHRLVVEQVPLADLGPVLECYAKARDEGLDSPAKLERMRAAVAMSLAPGQFDRSLIPLAGYLERRIEAFVGAVGQDRALMIPTREAEEILAEVDRVLGDIAPSAAALVVSNDSVRPFVQRLVDSRWAGVPVVSQTELGIIREPVKSTVPMVVV
jgi:tetratricopeptide (TPR) repeat protein